MFICSVICQFWKATNMSSSYSCNKHMHHCTKCSWCFRCICLENINEMCKTLEMRYKKKVREGVVMVPLTQLTYFRMCFGLRSFVCNNWFKFMYVFNTVSWRQLKKVPILVNSSSYIWQRCIKWDNKRDYFVFWFIWIQQRLILRRIRYFSQCRFYYFLRVLSIIEILVQTF